MTTQNSLADERFRFGFGTYTLTGDDGRAAIETALEAGFRHLDTARLYENEAVVGDALAASSVDRDDVFVATKVAHFLNGDPTPEGVRDAVAESRDRLGVDVIDLLYHHWPTSEAHVETVLPVFDELVSDGLVANVAVSNYPVRWLRLADDLLDAPIVANQVEMHPLLPQRDLHEFARDREMDLVAYAPLAQGEVFDVPEVTAVAEKHGVTEAQVSLAWLLQRDGVVPIPRSRSADHIRQNYQARTVDLDDEDVAKIDSINRRVRLEDPDSMEW